jgi:hypothetical protein
MYRVEIRPSKEWGGSEMAIFNDDLDRSCTRLRLDREVNPYEVQCETTEEIAAIADQYNCFYGPSALIGQHYDWTKRNREIYLKELRSGKWKKGCIKSDEKGYPIIETPEDDDGACACGIIYHLFPKANGKCTMLNARNSLGITRQDCDYIQYCLNDSPMTFPQIADILERTVFSKVNPMDENVEVIRAGGECICTTCGKDYDHHPRLPGHNWVTVLCDGGLVKT